MDTATQKDRRGCERFDIFLVVEFNCSTEDKEPFLGITNNVSAGGFSFESHDHALRPGEEMEFRLKQPERGLCVDVRGEPVWNSSAGAFECVTGVKLLDNDRTVESMLRELMPGVETAVPGPSAGCIHDEASAAPDCVSQVNEPVADADARRDNEMPQAADRQLHEAVLMPEEGRKKKLLLYAPVIMIAAIATAALLYIMPGQERMKDAGLSAPVTGSEGTGHAPLTGLPGSLPQPVQDENAVQSARSDLAPMPVQGMEDNNIKVQADHAGVVRPVPPVPRKAVDAGSVRDDRRVNISETVPSYNEDNADHQSRQVIPADRKTAVEGEAADAGEKTGMPEAAVVRPDNDTGRKIDAPKAPLNIPGIRFALVVKRDKPALPNSETPVFFEDQFDNNKNNWDIVNTAALSAQIRNGKYLIENRTKDSALAVFCRSGIKHGSRYILDVSMSAVAGAGKYSYGLAWGSHEDLKYYAFQITDKGTYFIEMVYKGRSRKLSYGNLKDNIINQGGVNNLRVVQDNGITRFYINGKVVDEIKAMLSYGDNVGFVAEGRSKISVDAIHVYGMNGEGGAGT